MLYLLVEKRCTLYGVLKKLPSTCRPFDWPQSLIALWTWSHGRVAVLWSTSRHPIRIHSILCPLFFSKAKFLAKRGKYYGPEFRMKIWEYEANKENGQVAFNRRLTRCNGCDGCVDAFYAFWEVATFTVHAPIQCPDTTSLQDPFLYLPTIPVPWRLFLQKSGLDSETPMVLWNQAVESSAALLAGSHKQKQYCLRSHYFPAGCPQCD